MKKNFLVIMGFVLLSVGVMGYVLYLLYNAMQVSEVIESELEAKEVNHNNGQSHEPKKDTHFAEAQSGEEKESAG